MNASARSLTAREVEALASVVAVSNRAEDGVATTKEICASVIVGYRVGQQCPTQEAMKPVLESLEDKGFIECAGEDLLADCSTWEPTPLGFNMANTDFSTVA